ncbi:MAG TPA: glucodextranase DOMON-like domain-containing protein [Acidobacteriota bacterium]|nr:glucodextranase DOMON-like domain-containing protein [Acidobacteriota bacterium]
MRLAAVVSLLLVAGAAVPAAVAPLAAAAPVPLFTLHDPRGDDHGDGSLLYPNRDDLAPGDLDLLSLTARAEKDGTTFEATFARPIRKPGREPIDAGGTALDRVARLGFYTFNLDLYVDTDRAPGSGRLGMLPGRKAEVDSSSAWERAIILTPRPFQALEALRDMKVKAAKDSLERSAPRVDDEDVARLKTAIEAEIESTVYFPTRIRVVGSRIRFFVPARFLGTAAHDGWSYVVVVSGADVAQRFALGTSFSGSADFAKGLMIVPIAPGQSRERFGGGRENDELMPPLVDVLLAPGVSQEAALKDYDRKAGRPVRLRGAVPAEAAAAR